jgi:hypothetical protein
MGDYTFLEQSRDGYRSVFMRMKGPCTSSSRFVRQAAPTCPVFLYFEPMQRFWMVAATAPPIQKQMVVFAKKVGWRSFGGLGWNVSLENSQGGGASFTFL